MAVRLFVLSALRNEVSACALGVVKMDRLAAYENKRDAVYSWVLHSGKTRPPFMCLLSR